MRNQKIKDLERAKKKAEIVLNATREGCSADHYIGDSLLICGEDKVLCDNCDDKIANLETEISNISLATTAAYLNMHNVGIHKIEEIMKDDKVKKLDRIKKIIDEI